MLSQYMDKQWQDILSTLINSHDFLELDQRITEEYNTHPIYPERKNIFNAINGLAPQDIRVVILGQDPYPTPGQAHGLAFSTANNSYPKSLINIFKELEDDIGIVASSTNLTPWKNQGVLLLNTVLTVRAHEPNSHANIGWQIVTEAILKAVLNTAQHKVFILWGKQAQEMFQKVYNGKTNVSTIQSVHPSPLSAYRGFFGSKPFSSTNELLIAHAQQPINWSL